MSCSKCGESDYWPQGQYRRCVRCGHIYSGRKIQPTKLRTDADIVLDILRMHDQGITSSWDWEMDLKFAEKIGDDVAVDFIKGLRGSVLSIRDHDCYIRSRITDRRLRALRKLVKKGLVESHWVGTGWGGRSDTGVNRLRGYMLTPKGREDGEG